jgi:hypothetical protein
LQVKTYPTLTTRNTLNIKGDDQRVTALIHLMQNCLDKAIDEFPACDQVTELNGLAELTTLSKTLIVIIRWTSLHDEGKVGMKAIGGVEAIVRVLQSFPKCQALQWRGCCALLNLVGYRIGKAKAIESGGIELNRASSCGSKQSITFRYVCVDACWALTYLVQGSKEHTELLIGLGCCAAVAEVRNEWLDDDEVQT